MVQTVRSPTTNPEDGTDTETTNPITGVLPTDNPYPAEEEGYVDPGSGFPTNPGTSCRRSLYSV